MSYKNIKQEGTLKEELLRSGGDHPTGGYPTRDCPTGDFQWEGILCGKTLLTLLSWNGNFCLEANLFV